MASVFQFFFHQFQQKHFVIAFFTSFHKIIKSDSGQPDFNQDHLILTQDHLIWFGTDWFDAELTNLTHDHLISPTTDLIRPGTTWFHLGHPHLIQDWLIWFDIELTDLTQEWLIWLRTVWFNLGKKGKLLTNVCIT